MAVFEERNLSCGFSVRSMGRNARSGESRHSKRLPAESLNMSRFCMSSTSRLSKREEADIPWRNTRALAAMEKAGGILLRDAARSAQVALGQAATGPSTTLHHVLAHGPLAKTIAREARRLKADLILMGSRGLSDIQGFLLGSISRQVASIAPCSVLVVKQPPHKLLHVTLAVDDSKPSRAAAEFLRSRILPETATVTILSSVESPVTDFAARYLSESQLAELNEPVMERATASGQRPAERVH